MTYPANSHTATQPVTPYVECPQDDLTWIDTTTGTVSSGISSRLCFSTALAASTVSSATGTSTSVVSFYTGTATSAVSFSTGTETTSIYFCYVLFWGNNRKVSP